MAQPAPGEQDAHPAYISALPPASFLSGGVRRLSILGSTGSIGRSALQVVDEQPDHFAVTALAGGSNTELLAQQAVRYRPAVLAVKDESARKRLREALALAAVPGYTPDIFMGDEGYACMAALPETEMVLAAQVGAAGLHGTVAALRAGKTVALANKESLVLAGHLIREECARQMRETREGRSTHACAILPVDSEHNAIFQCLSGQNALGSATIVWGQTGALQRAPCSPNPVKKLILTASGGPFRGKDAAFLQTVRKEDALAHPVWNMGSKISVDSATMMNKGLEIIEACHLFGLPQRQVDVLVHPQSIIHSFIEYADHSRLAQMGVPDMRVPIACCLGWPHRLSSGVAPLDLAGQTLTFEQPDVTAFPAMHLCRQALDEGRGLTAALNAANEVAVDLFLRDALSFPGITALCAETLTHWPHSAAPGTLAEALSMDADARRLAHELAVRIR